MVAAQVLTHLLWPVVQHTPFILGFGATIATSRFAGRGAGFLSIVIGVIGYEAFPPPGYSAFVGLTVGFAGVSGAFCWIVARQCDIEDALRASETRLAEAQQLAQIGSWDWNVLNGREVWSDEMCRIFGVDRRSAAPSFKAFSRFLHPDDRERVNRVIREALDHHQRFECEGQIVRPGGEVRSLHLQGRVVVRHDGQIVRLVVTAQDITQRKAAEEIIKRSEHRLQTIIDAEPACVKLVSADGALLEMNPAGLKMIGAESIYEVIGQSVADLIHPDDRERYLTAHRFASSGSPGRLEFRIIGLDGTERWVDSHMVPLDVAPAALTERSVLSVTSDITEKKRLEQQLQQSQKMEAVGQLAGGVAHDFNNLLTVIGGLTDLALEQVPHEAPVAADLREVATAARAAAALTKQLLLFSRRQVVQAVVLSVNDVVASVESLLRRTIGEDIRVDVSLAPDLRNIEGDFAHLQQVLMNLAVNARDAMPTGGVLLIETRNVELEEPAAQNLRLPTGPYVSLTVTDTGHGMDADTKARMFEPFFTTKARGRGTGLGLSTVYGIVQHLGGAVSVTSEVQRGTTLTVYFPAMTPQVELAVPEAKSAVETLAGAETILLVEDDDSVRTFGARVLREAGYTVLEASSPTQVLTLANQRDSEIDALVTDVIMPGMDGCELARRVRSLKPEAKVLFMSGYTDQVIHDHDLSLDRRALLQKPFTGVGLLQKLREVLDSDGHPELPRPGSLSPQAVGPDLVLQASKRPQQSHALRAP